MPWVIGIDEAGYGPNLGPLVQAAVPLNLPLNDPGGWLTLRERVRRAHEPVDGRLLIDDSKKVYAKGGLEALEIGARTALLLTEPTVGDLIRAIGIDGTPDDLLGEGWYDSVESLPVATSNGLRRDWERWTGGGTDGIGFGRPVAMVVPPSRFNRICDADGTKAAVLSRGLVALIRAAVGALPVDDGPVVIHCDKHGGRTYYAGMVQEAFPYGWVVSERETAEESRYRIDLLERPVTVVFRPRADAAVAAVAAASVLCKYLREVCMRQFNRYWTAHVPGLTPTAGYPDDARRFFAAIRPAMDKLKLTIEQVWRKR